MKFHAKAERGRLFEDAFDLRQRESDAFAKSVNCIGEPLACGGGHNVVADMRDVIVLALELGRKGVCGEKRGFNAHRPHLAQAPGRTLVPVTRCSTPASSQPMT